MNSSKYSVLYVDDEVINLRIFSNTFRRDFNVITAPSAKEGLEILEKEKIDVVITDQRMPEVCGVEFLKIVHHRFPHIPPSRLIVSGYAKDEDIEEAFNHYLLFSFISKPWQTNDLKQIILKSIENGK